MAGFLVALLFLVSCGKVPDTDGLPDSDADTVDNVDTVDTDPPEETDLPDTDPPPDLCGSHDAEPPPPGEPFPAAVAEICGSTGVAAVIMDRGTYLTIYDAIAAAVDGDVLYVCAGDHVESDWLWIDGVSIEVRGDPAGTTITIDGSSWQSHIFHVSGGPVTLADLTIHGGVDFYDYEAGCGAAIILSDDTAITLERVILRDNRADEGSAVCMFRGSLLRLIDSTIVDNWARSGRGAILMEFDTVVESIHSEWGEGADDNQPHDIQVGQYVGAPTCDYGADVTFTCDESLGRCY